MKGLELLEKWKKIIVDYKSYQENKVELFKDIEELWLLCFNMDMK